MAWSIDGTKLYGEVYVNGAKRVMAISTGKRRWFASRGFMLLGDKRRNVRLFETSDAAMRAADMATRNDFWA